MSDLKTPEADADIPEHILRKKELFAHVSEATGLRKKDVREVIQETLSYIHAALTEEKDVFIAPLGKVKVKRANEGTDRERMVYRLKLHDGGQKGEEEV